ncbi:TniQ family protein [Elizabethkingia anophelis]|uniref:TniQ family protein n=1 Tax=Elizabethkingia anophelis TaxID=1117645 RepID=UPI00389133A6
MHYLYEQRHLLPGYIPPEPDELLSSWIFRLAYAHKIKPYSFAKFYFNDPTLWSRDVDKEISPEILLKLCAVTPLTKFQIQKLQLTSYQDILYEGELRKSITVGNGLTNLGIYHRIRKRFGLFACPGCLRKKAYYKKHWRLHSSIICIDCNCYLIDRCPKCLNPIVFQRLAIGKKDLYEEKPIYLCWYCNHDLSTEKKIVIDSLALDYQDYIDGTILNAFNLHSQYSFLYFKVLYLFYQKIYTRSHNWLRVKMAFVNEFDLDLKKISINNLDSSIEERAKLLPCIYLVLKDWPYNFISFAKRHHLRYSDFSKDSMVLPFWFYEIFKKFF